MTSVDSQAFRRAGSSSRPSRRLQILMASVALLAGRESTALAQALPSGPSVAAGSVSISTPSGTSLIVDQSSPNAVVNWQSFSIGAGNTVHVNNGGGATLNRVTGNVPSRLDGSLTATGSVYLINPAGVAVGPGGRVATGGSFVASTLDVRDAEFLKGGDKTFSGTSKATVTNAGSIGSLGGDVALIARAVDNSGTIAAPKGTAALAAGYEVLARDGAVNGGKFQVKVGGADTEAKTTGTITAAVAELRANGGNVYALAGNTGGVIAATGTATSGGRVYLTAGDDGAVEAGGTIAATRTMETGATQGGDIRVSGGRATVSGTLTARGSSAPPIPGVKPARGAGGTVAVTGRTVTVAGTATVDASGSSGGAVAIGGDWQGGKDAGTKTLAETVANAATTSVAAGARLSADGSAGNGGSVVVWSDERTEFAGTISARGDGVGADGSAGNGGRAEVSGKAVLSFQGTADLRAGRDGAGRTGSLLLDPYDLTISNGTDSGVSGFSATGNDSVLSAGTLTAALGTANVTVSTGSGGSQEGNITVAAPVSWSADTALTLQAAGNIAVNAAVTATGSSAGLVLEHGAGKDYSVAAPITLSGSNATLQIGPTGDLTSYTLLHDMSAFAQLNNDPIGNYALAQSLNADGTTYTDSPVNSAFFGTFAGLGNSISNLTINALSADGVGLFYDAGTGSVIRDLTLTGTVTGAEHTGGLAGYSRGLIRNVNTAVTVTGTNHVGGLAGEMTGGSVIDSSATGAVNGASYLGGLIGSLGNQGVTLTRTHATGTVTSTASGVQSYIGGLVGNNDGTPIVSSYATGDVRKSSGPSNYSGGLVGRNRGDISNAYATGQVGNAEAGTVGGLIGQNVSGALSKVYATGSVTGTNQVGGLIGSNNGTVTQAYATGAVRGGGTDVGGLIGHDGGTVTASYWDTETTGQASSAGGSGVVGLTTAQARGRSNYAGWDFTTDWYQEGDLRPIGRWEASADGTITNAHQLQLVAAAPSGTYRLSRDVDAGATADSSNAGIWSSSGFMPIGTGGTPFSGTFDGGGHTISNLTINRPSTDGVGLFSMAVTASVISNLTLTGTVTGRAYTGGLAALGYGLVNNVNTAVTVTGTDQVGGLIGDMSGGSVIDSSAAGAVNGASSIGGLIGNLGDQGVILTRSHATGTVTSIASGAQFNIGGLVGSNLGTPIVSSYATGDVRTASATANYSGGLVGANYGTIRDSYATGSVTNSSYAGGLVGQNSGDITNAYATGQVGNADVNTVGGLIGQNISGTLSKVYATGSVTGTSKVGGLIGDNTAGVTQAYATGAVSGGSTDVGGLIGSNGGTVTASYWDKETTGQANSAGGGGVVGLTTAQARDKSNYAGWNFATDWYQEGDLRPIGRWEASADGTITNAHQLQLVAAAPSGTYRLSRDIDAGATAGSSNAGIWSSSGFVPIGSGGTPFSGTFDGGGHTISNLTINRPSTDGVGLFSNAWAGSVIRDLTLTGTVTGGMYTGGLAGHGSGLIKNVNTAVTVTGTERVGGLVGEMAQDMAGGSVIDSSAAGAVNGASNIGGLIGILGEQGVILTGSHATGTVTSIASGAQSYIGGLVGFNSGTPIESSYATGDVRKSSGTSNYSGGLVGFNTGTIRNSYATGSVTNSSTAGGLAGYNESSISNAYATGQVGNADADTVGGLIGQNSGTLSKVYATGSVTGTSKVGGLIGNNDGAAVTQAYATGAVTGGNTDVGGLIGLSWGAVTASYWDTETTGQASSAGGDGVVGLTTAQARDKSNYAGWNFTTDWYQEDDLRPIGRWEASADGTITNAHQLQLVAAAPSGTYRLSRDIDAGATAGSSNAGIWSSSGFVPIGSGGTPFSGTFDGGGHTISNLTINRSSTDGVGLFSEAGAASVIRDLTLTGTMTGGAYTGGLAGRGSGLIKTVNTAVTVTGTDHVGGLVGEMAGGSVIDSSAANEVNGEGYIGGLIGRVDGTTTTLTRVHADGTVTNISQGGARAFNGGLVGYNNGGTIESSYATGEVRADSGTANYSGGLVGENTGTIRDSYATGNVPGSWDAGGLVGRNWGNISNSYATGSVGGDGMNSVGGLIGDHYTGTLSNVYATGSVNGNGPVGGLIGYMEAGSLADAFASGDANSAFSPVGGLIGLVASGSVTRAYATGSVTWSTGPYNSLTPYAGGLIGFNGGTVSQVYATGSVTGTDVVGGLIGRNNGRVTQAYATGAVSGSGSAIGGLIGSGNGTVTASYWDMDGTGQANSAGGSGAVGLTTAEMQTRSSFSGWDWRVWAPPVTGSYRPELYGVSGVVGGIRSITYGDDPAGAAVTMVGGGWWNSVTGTLSVGSLTATEAGAYDLAVSGASGTTRTGNATRFAGAGIVDKATLTITAANGSMTYGDTPPTGITYTATGWKNGQTSSLLTGVTTSTTATATSNVGSYATSASGGSLSGAATGNYTLSYVNGAMTVTPATLTVTAGNSSMVYGDTPPSDIAYTATGWKNGQTSSLLSSVTTATTATATSNAGSYATSASGGSLSGAATGNYSLSYVDGTMSVTPATLTVTAGNGSMVYGDTPPSDIAYTATGWKNGQTSSLLSSVTTATTATATSNAGSYATSASGGSLSGGATGNYTLSYVNGTMSVTPATLTVTAADSSMVYGDTPPSNIGYTATGWKNGQTDSLLSSVTTSTTATATSNVGSYATSASGGSLGGSATGNYSLSYVDGTMSVTPATLTVTAGSGSMVYGGSVPTIGYATTGWKNGQTGSLLTGVSTGTAATSTSNIGSYATSASGGTLGGDATGNYTILHQSGAVSVTPRQISVTADGKSRVYGDANPTLTYSVGGDGLVNGDTLSGTLATAAGATASLGSYAIGQGTLAASLNYSLVFNPGTLSVTARPITVTADGKSRIYGDANPALTYSVGGASLVNGDTLSGTLATAAGTASAVGAYAIGQGTLAASLNYSLVFNPGTLSVTARPITVTVDSKSRAFGDANPALTYSVGGAGLVNGDTLSGALATAAGTASPAGSYAISQGTLAASSNYALTFGTGVLTVQQADSSSVPPTNAPPPQEVARQVIVATLPRNLVETTGQGTDTAFSGDGIVLSVGDSAPNTGTRSATASASPGADSQGGNGVRQDGGDAACIGGAAGAACAAQPHPANTRVGRFLRFFQQP
ncbi:MBG domain-containing protein [Azospirillum humicireducens]|nr:MBG domain-containing protein [Azospirillum humicireducens]